MQEGVRKCLLITVLISLGLTALMFFLGRFFMRFFIDPAETGIMNSSMQYVRTTSVFYVILGVNFIVRFALAGVGRTFASPACWLTSTLLCVACYKPMMDSAKRALEKRLQPAE